MISVFFTSLLLLLVSCSFFSEPSNTASNTASNAASNQASKISYKKNKLPNTQNLQCVLPICEGSSCCTLRDDCFDICTEELGLHRILCKRLSSGDIYDLLDIFKVIDSPNKDNLADELSSNIKLVCGAVDEDSKILTSRIIKYNTAQAQDFLIWLADEEDALVLLENSGYNSGILKTLLQKLNPDMIQALKSKITSSQNILEYALSKKNIKLVEYIHQKFVLDNVCHNLSNQPKFIDKNQDFKYIKSKTKSDGENACILGVYCQIIYGQIGSTSTSNINNKLIKNIDKTLANVMDRFISSGDSGLKFSKDEPDIGEFDEACSALNKTDSAGNPTWKFAREFPTF